MKAYLLLFLLFVCPLHAQNGYASDRTWAEVERLVEEDDKQRAEKAVDLYYKEQAKSRSRSSDGSFLWLIIGVICVVLFFWLKDGNSIDK